ncbi:polysaccharide deacetylase family protein [Couchioplanes azureus]|uniref:polysaccharide deacetylase family protein n=1 Tax=Couchioplanes caeruleus TaxID=56438 RepID=UPI0019A3EF18|nr:polysaccharide deacetylase family protein [Couchioplanes caeruleus]GGQ39300.1 hypothetical protein GCM10010166_02580 [Couchioplanes caeruleus subsp. azureus]
MPPHPPENTAPQQGPRHAAGTAHPALTGGIGSFPLVGRLANDTALGRHRRTESPAAPTVPSPPTTEHDRGRPGADEAGVAAGLAGHETPDARPSSTPRRGARASRGRHAAADQLAITVRPLPAVREAAEAVRDWALADAGKRPATGAHRAPGTLPIESWLLIGRHRQQALLGALVAVGLMLLVVPMQQSGDSTVTAVNAAENAVAVPPKPSAKKPGKDAGATAPAKPQSPQDGPATAAPANPSAPPPAQNPAPAAPSATATAPAPAVLPIPEGDGPAKSLRTTGTETVALTFDDGPDPVQTPKILALLEEHQVTAMFCLVGEQARRHPDIVRDIAAAGHALCNHSWNHSFTLGKEEPAKIREDLLRTNDAIRAAVPDAKIPYFRAPGGNFTDRLVRTAYAEGMTSLYWEVDPRDWERTPAETGDSHVEKIIREVTVNVRPGSIVLSHDFAQPETVEAYETLLPRLRERFTLGLPTVPAPPPPAASAPASAPQ